MILDTTYMPDDKVALINEKVGESYSLMQRIKMRGAGSHHMVIEQYSPNFHSILTRNNSTNYCSIELRPNGIIVHIHKRLNSYAWLVPYHLMSIYKSKTFSIHAAGEFLKLRLDKNFDVNKKLLDRMLERKNEQVLQGAMPL